MVELTLASSARGSASFFLVRLLTRLVEALALAFAQPVSLALGGDLCGGLVLARTCRSVATGGLQPERESGGAKS